MARHDAVFGGEHSAHYYFRDFWFADTGMLAAMHVLAALGEQDAPLSELVAELQPLRRLRRDQLHGRRRRGRHRDRPAWAATAGRRHSTSSTGSPSPTRGEPMWWFNLRASNTEPLLRLNVEAADEATMARVRDEVLAIVRGESDD